MSGLDFKLPSWEAVRENEKRPMSAILDFSFERKKGEVDPPGFYSLMLKPDICFDCRVKIMGSLSNQPTQ